MKPGQPHEQEMPHAPGAPAASPPTSWPACASSRRAAEIVLAHHEQPDGAGYPRGLVGDAVPLGSRIIMVVAAFDAMTSDRPYRRGLAPEEAFEELLAHAGTQFFPDVVEALIQLYAAARCSTSSTTAHLERYPDGARQLARGRGYACSRAAAAGVPDKLGLVGADGGADAQDGGSAQTARSRCSSSRAPSRARRRSAIGSVADCCARPVAPAPSSSLTLAGVDGARQDRGRDDSAARARTTRTPSASSRRGPGARLPARARRRHGRRRRGRGREPSRGRHGRARVPEGQRARRAPRDALASAFQAANRTVHASSGDDGFAAWARRARPRWIVGACQWATSATAAPTS